VQLYALRERNEGLAFQHYPTSTKQKMSKLFTEKAEKLNGRLAMCGIVAAIGAYLVTGQVIPGIW
jgi:hypothetical protein